MKGYVWSMSKNKKVKTITGTTNSNGYFWNQFNKYCKEKGYTIRIENNKYTGGLVWQNKEGNVLEFKWEEEII